jgi:signal transduction histidine kinase
MSNCYLSSLQPLDLKLWDSCHLLILASSDARISDVFQTLAAHDLNFTYDLVSTYTSYKSCLTQSNYDLILFYQNSPVLVQQGLQLLVNYLPKIPVIIVSNSALNYGDFPHHYLPSIALDQLPLIIEQNLALSQQEKQEQYQNLIQATMTKIADGLSLEQIAQDTVNLLQKVLGVNFCFLLKPENDHNLIIKYSAQNLPDFSQYLGSKCQIYYYYKSLLIKNQPLAFSQIDQHSPQPLQDFAQKQQIASMMIMPIFYQVQFLGVICLQHQQQHQWTKAEKTLVTIIANQLAIAICQEQLKQELTHQTAIALNHSETYQQLEQQYQKRTQELELEKQKSEKANQAKTDFLSQMTHELRTPMTGILGFSKMLMEQIYGTLNDKQMQYVKAIFDSGQHLLELINDLLDISKIEAEREELFCESIPIEDLCLASMSIVQERALHNGLELNLELDPEINVCFGDQRRLKQILVNLLSNAIKFTEKGSVTLKVEADQEMIFFSVIDTGIGISETDQQKLFKPFSQIRNRLSNKYKGTGLGLVLSLKLAKLHGGDLTLTSEVGKGSCFTLKIPRIY